MRTAFLPLSTLLRVCSTMFLLWNFCCTSLYAARTLTVFPTNSPTQAVSYNFREKGGNVSTEKWVQASVTGSMSDYTFYVGEDGSRIGNSKDVVFSTISTFQSCSSGSFSLSIYDDEEHQGDDNYYIHDPICMDVTEYTYGMICWNNLTNDCGSITQVNHVFSKTGVDTWSMRFTLQNPSAVFKLFLSSDGETWSYNAGQLGYPDSRTMLSYGTGVLIEKTSSGWYDGNCSLNLPGVSVGDQVTLVLVKQGANYTLSAYYSQELPAPTVEPYQACQTEGTAPWSSLVTPSTGCILQWYADAAGQSPIAEPEAFDKQEVQKTTYYVSQKKDGTESAIVPVVVEVLTRPEAPLVQSYRECQMNGTATWSSLVTPTAGYTLQWYSDAAGQVPISEPAAFDKQVVQNNTYYVSQQKDGCESAVVSVTVAVYAKPQALVGEDKMACFGSAVQLGAAPVEDVSYAWEPAAMLVDATVANPTTVPLTVEQNFTLTVNKYSYPLPSCQSSATVHVGIIPVPELGLSYEPTQLCPGETVTLKNKVDQSPTVSYQWSPADKVLSPSSATTQTQPLAATTRFTLTATDQSTACAVSASINVNVTKAPTAKIGGNRSICSGEITSLGTTAASGVTYEWTPADKVNNPRAPQPNTVPLTETTVFHLKVTMQTAPFCSATDEATVFVNEFPSVYTVSGGGVSCELPEDMEVELSGSELWAAYCLYKDGQPYGTWVNGTGKPMKLPVKEEGTYTVKARNKSGVTCVVDMEGYASFQKSDPPTVIFRPFARVCPGESATVALDFTGKAPFTFDMDINGRVETYISESESFSMTYQPTGNTTFKVLRLQDGNCEVKYGKNPPSITLRYTPPESFVIHSDPEDATVCPGVSARLFVDYTGTDVEYLWSTGETAREITVQPAVTTAYTLRIKMKNGCEIVNSKTVYVGLQQRITISGVSKTQTYCSGDDPSYFVATPVGGVFSSMPASAALTSGGYFDPSKIKVSTTLAVTYSITDTYGCTQDTTFNVYINVSPQVDWCVYPDVKPFQKSYTYCIPEGQEKTFKLVGDPGQANGQWKLYKEGSGSSTLSPVKGPTSNLLNASEGTYNIEYSIVDNKGCVGKMIKPLIIREETQKKIENDDIYVMNEHHLKTDTLCSVSTLAYIVATNVGGKFTLSAPAMKISEDVSRATMTINPSKSGGLGGQSAIYTMTDDQGCPTKYIKNFYIKAPTNIYPFGLKKSYCDYEPEAPITIQSERPTTGTISVYKNGDYEHPVLEKFVPMEGTAYFLPSWGEGNYEITYVYNDGICDFSRTEKVEVHKPDVIAMNLAYDFCLGDVIVLKPTPGGGLFGTDAPGNPLVNNLFYTKRAGLGTYRIWYTVNNEYACTSSDTTDILIHGTDNLGIYNLEPEYCEPKGTVMISGMPKEPGTGLFAGPAFLTNLSSGSAKLDLSQSSHTTTYTVTYNYTQQYTRKEGGEASCTSSTNKKFTVLNKSSDFAGVEDGDVICATGGAILLTGNHAPQGRFEFSQKSSPGFEDLGNGTAKVYPDRLSESDYTVTYYYDYKKKDEQGKEYVVCTTEKSKTFHIAQMPVFPPAELVCQEGYPMVRIHQTNPQVTYSLYVGDKMIESKLGNGGDLDFTPLTSNCYVNLKATLGQCTVEREEGLMAQVLEISSSSASNVTCYDLMNGKFVANVRGGTYPYVHQIASVSGSVSYNDSVAVTLGPDSYRYTVMDNIGCQRSQMFDITQPDPLHVTLQPYDLQCADVMDGRIESTVTGGTTPYNYKWYKLPDETPISNASVLSHVGPGQYRVDVTDLHACAPDGSSVTSAGITSPELLKVVLVSKVDVLITGESTGAITVEVSGGVLPYFFTWEGPGITEANRHKQNLTDLPAGDYYLTVADDRDCRDELQVSITEPSIINVSAEVTHVNCFGESNGQIVLNIEGGTKPFRYSWEGPEGFTSTERDLDHIIAGAYSFHLEDSRGKTYDNVYVVKQPSLLEVELLVSSADTVNCYGDKTAHMEVRVEGSVEPYQLKWTGPDIPAMLLDPYALTDLGAGTYQLEVTDAHRCTASLTHEITQPEKQTLQVALQQNRCYLGREGKATLTVTGGVEPRVYAWSGLNVVPDSKDQTALVAGERYQVEVTDRNHCLVSESFTMLNPAELQGRLTQSDVSCHGAADGWLEVTASGGTPPYYYRWTRAGETTLISPDAKVEGLDPGTYICEVGDTLGCTLQLEATITEPLALDAKTSSTPVLCYGDKTGTARVIVTPGTGSAPYTYVWIKAEDGTEVANTAIANHLEAGTYKVTVQDRHGCTWSDYVTVTQPTAIDLKYKKTDIAIFGEATGTITLTVSGGTPDYTYEWYGKSITEETRHQKDQVGLAAGNYYVTVTDANGCSTQAMITLVQPERVLVQATLKNVSCKGASDASILLTVTGGVPPYSYTWTGPDGFHSSSRDITDVAAGQYHLLVKDIDNNTYENDYELTEPEALSITFYSSVTEVNCFGDKTASLNVDFAGGTQPYRAIWSGPDIHTQPQDVTHVSDLGVGVYQVYVTDANGCREQASQTITEPEVLFVEYHLTETTCAGTPTGAIDLTVSGGTPEYAFVWSGEGVRPTAQNQSSLPGGPYEVQITDQRGCLRLESMYLQKPTAMSLRIDTVNVLCQGEKNGSVRAYVEGGIPPYRMQWVDAAGQVLSIDAYMNELGAGRYTFQVQDSLGCTLSQTAEVTEPERLEATLTVTPVLCAGMSDGYAEVQVKEGSGTPPYTYRWYKNITTYMGSGYSLSNLPAGAYRVEVADKNGCQLSLDAEIREAVALNIEILSITPVQEHGEATGAIQLQVSGGTGELHYTWTGSGIDPAHAHELNQSNLIAGWYYLLVEDDLGCSETLAVEITEPGVLVVKPKVSPITCHGMKNGYIELEVTGSTQLSYVWKQNGQAFSTDKNIYDLGVGTYSLHVTGGAGEEKDMEFVMSEPTELKLGMLPSSKLDLACAGDHDGNINIQVQGGTQPYTLVWSGPDIPPTVSNPYSVDQLGVGLYRVDITDANRCYVSDNYEITMPERIRMEAEITGNICFEQSHGSILLTVSGGEPDYMYQWTGTGVQVHDRDQYNLLGGDYTLRLTDQNECVIDTSFHVSRPERLFAHLTANTDICEGDSLVLYMASGGIAPWVYVFSDGQREYTVTTQRPDTSVVVWPKKDTDYQLKQVTDGKGCSVEPQGIINVTVHKRPSLQVLSADNSCCLGGTLAVDLVVANEGPWVVQYSDRQGYKVQYDVTNMHQTMEIAPLWSGQVKYTIDSVSNTYCSSKVDYDIEAIVYPMPDVTITMPALVCQSDEIHIMLEPDGIAPWQIVYYENDVRYYLDIEGDYELVRTPETKDNVYRFESITSGKNCRHRIDETYEVALRQKPAELGAIVGKKEVCRGSLEHYIVPKADRADLYEWTLPEGFTLLSGLGSNDIVVEVGDKAATGVIRVRASNKCGSTLDATLSVDVDLPFGEEGEIAVPQYVCENWELFRLYIDEVKGATAYDWVLPPHYEILSGRNSASLLVQIDAYAQSGTVKVTPYNRCARATTMEKYMTIRDLPLAEAGRDFVTDCTREGQMNATPVPGATTKWTILQGENITFDDITSPTAKVSGLYYGKNPFRWEVNDGYCVGTDTMAIYSDDPGITQPEFTSLTICEDVVTLRADQPLYGNVRWTLLSGDGEIHTPEAASTLVTGLSTRTPNVIRWEVYTDNCSNRINVEVVSHDLRQLVDAGEDGVTTNGVYRLSARKVVEPGVTGTWSVVSGAGTFANPHAYQTTVTGLQPGINTFRWTLDAYECSAFDDVHVRLVDEPVADFTMDVSEGCHPLTVYFSNTSLGEAQFQWDFGDGQTSTQRSPEHIFESPGIYPVTLVAVGKQRTDKITKDVTVRPSPHSAFSAQATQVYLPDAEAHFYDESTDAQSYLWMFGDGDTSKEKNPVHTYRTDGSYTVTLITTNSYGCQDTLAVKDFMRVGKSSWLVFPSAFTPNLSSPIDGHYSEGERRLDTFYPVSRHIDTYKLEIFNSWGVMVFRTEDLYQGWNGWYMGKVADQGTYSYKAEGRYKDGTSYRVSGVFMLMR